MNKNDFLGLIGNKDPIDRQVLAELNEIVNIFPYFQTAHLLLLKGLQDNSDIRFENQLRTSAIHIADREVLYNLLKVTPESIEKENEVVAETPQTVTFEPELPVDYTQAVDYEPEKQLNVPETEMQEAITEVEPAEEVIMSEVSGEQRSENDSVDMEQTVIESAKNSEDMIVEIEKESVTSDGFEREEDIDELMNRSILVSIDSEDDESVERSVIMINEESDDSGERIFYMDPGFAVPINEEFPEEESITGEELQLPSEPVAEEVILEKELSEESRRKTQSDLIDKFITESPRIEPKREISDQPVEDLAKKFTEEKGGFVTETLARIYISQGYYSKAIDIYETLSLKFPEKSDYFAAQIEKIKAILK